ncbi:MAG: VWA domain-containing protein [Akkermansiaceae bacterium]|jgi:secreted protein with Ig-like and vWFA domain|nr:VWA domain-containing protein [Akkermansiaceae bacterium]MDP4646334.1 VWA domain-containing protein [Akkermansiaceae bacterium]MDP4779937.1 VWA domain-containing protein [Akkermansiaceae bacterium]MDP4897158.1 VWA domain-containing protein [Akkermansiaceae bacterium]MDP4995490.1 VWA domain-containing protein [Akkermansiaceae bacterium]
MNPELPNPPEDRLIDELLREQAHGHDEVFLQQVEQAIDARPAIPKKLPVRRNYTRIAIAACFGLAAGTLAFHHLQNLHTQADYLAYQESRKLTPDVDIEALKISVREQEDIVEEKRKVLTQIARTKDIVFGGDEEPRTLSLPTEVAALGDVTNSDLDFGSSDDFGRGWGDSDREGQGGGGFAPLPDRPADKQSNDRYGTFIDQPWKSPDREPLSTFSIDVDTASYANVRRMIREGRDIPRDAVRIEEFINAFNYNYDAPKGDGPFAVGADLAMCPWAPDHQLVRIFIKGREIEAKTRPASNLVFLIDVSGSMQSSDKLPLLKQSMQTLVGQLDERDSVAIVVYAGSEGVALPSTRLDEEGRATVIQTLSKLEAGGSTNGGAGINRAYQLAMEQKIEGGVNRVILATDGDFNVGITGQESLVELVKSRAKNGVYLTVVGFGSGNLNDSMMDAITRDGNGNYFYIGSEREGHKVFLQNLTGTLVTIAKDVKIQVDFNPAKVGSYRLIGYSNRVLKNEDFNNDAVDAGDIGAGHTVTAFYEIAPPVAEDNENKSKYQSEEKPANSQDWLTVRLRHKHPEGEQSGLIEFPLTGNPAPVDRTDTDFQFATAAALMGMKIRGMEEVADFGWEKVIALAKPGLANDITEDRAEFIELVNKLNGDKTSDTPRPRIVPPSPGKAEVITPAPER